MAELIKKTDTLNEGREKLNDAITDAEAAKVVSGQADDKASEALAKSESTQTQLDTIVIEGDSSVEAAQARVTAEGTAYGTLKERLDAENSSVTSQLAQTAVDLEIKKMDRDTRDISVSQINKNLGKIDQTYLSDELLQQIAGDAPIHAVPADGGVATKKLADNAVTYDKQDVLKADLGENLFSGVYHKRWIDSTTGSYGVNEQTSLAIIPIENGKIYQVTTRGTHDRFVVSLLNDVANFNGTADVRYAAISTTGNNSFRFRNNDNYSFLAVGVSASNEEPDLSVICLNSKVLLNEVNKQDLSKKYVNKYMNYLTGKILEEDSDRGIITQVLRGSTITIETLGEHDRFAIGGFNHQENTAGVIYKGSGDGVSSGYENYTFINNDYDFIIINISSNGLFKPPVNMTESLPKSIEISQEEKTIKSERLENYSIHYKKQNFIRSESKGFKNDVTLSKGISVIELLDKYENKWVNYNTGKLMDVSTPRSIVCEIPKNSEIKIETFGYHDRFTVTLMNNSISGSLGEVIFAGPNSDGTSSGNETFTFKNTNHSIVVIGISSSSIRPWARLTIEEDDIQLATMEDLKTHNTSEVDTGITNVTETYPVLFGVKMSNSHDVAASIADNPRPIGWLYYTPTYPYKLIYANGTPDNMKFLCYWDESVTWDGISSPEKYRPFITKDGDIIFVWRGDLLGLMSDHPDSRQNPIIYPSGDWDNPIEIDLGTGLKPTSWLQNCGADYIYNRDVFLFAEYTRPHHKTTNVWRVTKPFTDPSNWEVVQSFELSGSNQTGMKHCHTAQYDTFSGRTYVTTGDDDSASKILVSHDYGLTWEVVFEGNRRYARVLNFVFIEEGAYWANDDGNHGFFFAPRDINGVVDFTQITELYDLNGYPPSYVNVLINDPYGILILHRWDGVVADSTLGVHFWDIKTSTMHVIKEINPVDPNDVYGFRVEAINFYQARGDDSIVAGFANPFNNMDLLNNYGTSNETRINNLVMKVLRDGTGFDLKVSAISDRS